MSDGRELEDRVRGLFASRSFWSTEDAVSALYPELVKWSGPYNVARQKVYYAALMLAGRGILDGDDDGDFWIPFSGRMTLGDRNV